MIDNSCEYIDKRNDKENFPKGLFQASDSHIKELERHADAKNQYVFGNLNDPETVHKIDHHSGDPRLFSENTNFQEDLHHSENYQVKKKTQIVSMKQFDFTLNMQ